MAKAAHFIGKKEGAPDTAHIYIGVMSPSIRKPRHAQTACFGARMEHQRAQVDTLVVFGRGGNVGGHMGRDFVSGWREG